MTQTNKGIAPVALERVYLCALSAIQLVVAYEWGHAGWEKVMGGSFPVELGTTLGKFASENPTDWYRGFLESVAIPNAAVFGQMVQWGQLAIALALVLEVIAWLLHRPRAQARILQGLAAVALAFGAFMSLNFYLAAGWMSASTAGINLVLLLVQVTLLYVKVAQARR